MSKEEFYKYGESLGIRINDLQRLRMLAMADKKYTEEDLMSAFNAGINNDYGNGPSFDKWLNSLNKAD